MKIHNIILIVVIALTGLSCQSIKDGLSGKKSENSDEFLVQKKSPLVLPPKFLELPQPKDKNDDSDEKNIQFNYRNYCNHFFGYFNHDHKDKGYKGLFSLLYFCWCNRQLI